MLHHYDGWQMPQSTEHHHVGLHVQPVDKGAESAACAKLDLDDCEQAKMRSPGAHCLGKNNDANHGRLHEERRGEA